MVNFEHGDNELQVKRISNALCCGTETEMTLPFEGTSNYSIAARITKGLEIHALILNTDFGDRS